MSIVQNQIKALVSFCTFLLLGKKSPHFLNTQKSRATMIRLRRIGLGWVPGATIGVVSGFFIFNVPLREFHGVKNRGAEVERAGKGKKR